MTRSCFFPAIRKEQVFPLGCPSPVHRRSPNVHCALAIPLKIPLTGGAPPSTSPSSRHVLGAGRVKKQVSTPLGGPTLGTRAWPQLGARPTPFARTLLSLTLQPRPAGQDSQTESTQTPRGPLGKASGREEGSLRPESPNYAPGRFPRRPRAPPSPSRTDTPHAPDSAPRRLVASPLPRTQAGTSRAARTERDGVSSLTSQRLVHASNAAIQLEDAQGLHAHAAAAAASELGLPVLSRPSSARPAPSPLVPRRFSSPSPAATGSEGF